ncbi:MAG TPA: SDR family oxidoreductase [Anaerolineales bacterium]|nr:SDR family oxidoreductase [Anaerolineales bacterium]
MRLQNKIALITGGTSGIGKATAKLFAAEGARVAFTGRRAELGEAAARQIGGLFVKADHRRPEDCERSVRETLAAFGRIDILFNNAGVVLSGTAESTSEADWAETLEVNVTAVWRMCRAVIPIMRGQGGGIIVNNASDWGLVGAKEALVYCASKGAVIQMTRCMALDHAGEKIRVNAVCPGDTVVERWVSDGYFQGSGAVDGAAARTETDLPLGRAAEVSEIARAVLFLSSDESSFMTGQTLVVDGGNTAR